MPDTECACGKCNCSTKKEQHYAYTIDESNMTITLKPVKDKGYTVKYKD